ncbi:MAG TPA: GNAT family N-acetyltransferase [Nocardioidaceae bacterium]|nr:GNAT family N-acetyltransferase [Nocardioidaceae bacterium]
MQIASDSGTAEYDDPFIRWRLDPAAIERVHRHGEAVLVEQRLDRHGDPVTGPTLLCIGPVDDLAPLVDDAVHRIGEVPHQISIEHHAAHLLPTAWQWAQRRVWDWMWTTQPPAPVPGEDSVVPLAGAGLSEADAVLDAANPDSHGRPGGSDVQRWLGVRDTDGALVATGGMFVLPTGISHLRGITTLPAARGRGIGTALSARLTRLGLGRGGGVCTLGAYTANTRAIEIYRRLGFRHAHTFSSGTFAR